MDDAFERKLRAAVSAGWRVVIVEAAVLTLLWVVYLVLMGTRPPAILALWGPGATWSTFAMVTILAIAAFKVALWLQIALLAWGSLWASTLRRESKPATIVVAKRDHREGHAQPSPR